MRQVRKRAIDDFLLDLVDDEELLANPTEYTDLLYGNMVSTCHILMTWGQRSLVGLQKEGGR